MLALTAVVLGVVSIAPAQAQAAQHTQTSAQQFNVPAGSLSAALLRYGEQAGLQLNVSSKLTDGKRTAGLSGKYTLEGGLRALLAGSGLTFRFTGPRSVVIETLPDTGDARVLGPLRVEGAQSGSVVNGINGSTDITATEGTKSYTSGALSIGSKAPRSMKDTPQSVSVVTQERIKDQNISDFTSLMKETPGITVLGGDSDPYFYSRGFAIHRIQIDGGSPLNMQGPDSGYRPNIDMAMYDHAEVLRGSDGLLNGYGAPGGAINLTRKKPLGQNQVVLDAKYGSWSQQRMTLDMAGPIGFGGRLRGRTVMSWSEQDNFYDTANSESRSNYGIVELDLTAKTTLTAGFSNTTKNELPFMEGLPRYEGGDDLNLPRSTCLCFSWSRYLTKDKEVFLGLDHKFSEGWDLHFKATEIRQSRDYKYGVARGAGVNRETGGGFLLSALIGDFDGTHTSADAFLSGKFSLFGYEQSIVVGASYAEQGGGPNNYYDSLIPYGTNPPVDVLNFNPNGYLEPPRPPVSNRGNKVGSTQSGAYATLALRFWKPLRIDLGVRYSRYENFSDFDILCKDAISCPGRQVGDVLLSFSRSYNNTNTSWPPNLALTYDLNEDWAVYGSFADMYSDQSNLLQPDGTPLDPVSGNNVELGIKWASSASALNASLAIYRIRQENFSVYIPDHPLSGSPDGNRYCCYTTGDDFFYQTQGVDIEVGGELTPGWQISASYTYSDVERFSGQFSPQLTQAPPHMAKLWTSYQFGGSLNRLTVAGGFNAQTNTYVNGSACASYVSSGEGGPVCETYIPYEYTQSGYAIFSARAAYQWNANWNIALNVNNITDKKYYSTVGSSGGGSWYGPPRNFMLSVRGAF